MVKYIQLQYLISMQGPFRKVPLSITVLTHTSSFCLPAALPSAKLSGRTPETYPSPGNQYPALA